jgi:hypothetical protein
MKLEDIKIGIVKNGLPKEVVDQVSDEELLGFSNLLDISSDKELGFSTVCLMIGLRYNDFDKEQSLSIISELMNNKKLVDNETEIDWLLTKTKLNIK